MRDNWLSNRIFKSFDDIVDHSCDAWNKLIDQPWRIISIGLRDCSMGHDHRVLVLAANMILAEIGLDMGRLPTAGHIVAWSSLCTGPNESAGKRKSSKLRKGAPWLKTTLVQCAVSASNKKDSYFRAQFQRLKSRRGAPKAFCAVAASLLTAIYHMRRDGTKFRDLGEDHFDKRPMKAKVNRLLAQLAKLGYQADLRPFANAA